MVSKMKKAELLILVDRVVAEELAYKDACDAKVPPGPADRGEFEKLDALKEFARRRVELARRDINKFVVEM